MNDMKYDSCTITLSKQELMRIEVIVMDGDKDDALMFLRELRSRIQTTTITGMKSHLDGGNTKISR